MRLGFLRRSAKLSVRWECSRFAAQNSDPPGSEWSEETCPLFEASEIGSMRRIAMSFLLFWLPEIRLLFSHPRTKFCHTQLSWILALFPSPAYRCTQGNSSCKPASIPSAHFSALRASSLVWTTPTLTAGFLASRSLCTLDLCTEFLSFSMQFAQSSSGLALSGFLFPGSLAVSGLCTRIQPGI